jgi:hypothetical protein
MPDQPLSYCVMPLPQTSDQPGRPSGAGRYSGFILKNFSFTETVLFHGPGAISNAGGSSGGPLYHGVGGDRRL